MGGRLFNHILSLLSAAFLMSCIPTSSSSADPGDDTETVATGQACPNDGMTVCDTDDGGVEGGVLCEERGWECGVILGAFCGSCPGNQRCENGICVCEGECDGTRCHDGCGHFCPCPPGTECDLAGFCVEENPCEDTCDGTHCGENDCGGICECSQGKVCDPEKKCVEPEPCTENCGDFIGECGTVCGDVCGVCPDDKNCLGGACLESRNCNDCTLVLELHKKVMNSGTLDGALLTLDYKPGPLEPRPRLFDLYLTVDKNVALVNVTPGAALAESGKSLVQHETTGKPWAREGNQYRLVALSPGNTDKLHSGRIATLEFDIDTNRNVSFFISRRDQIFAPADADAALQLSDYDGEVVVSQ